MADRFPVILPPQSANDSEVAATNKRDKPPDMDKSFYILSGPLTIQNNNVINTITHTGISRRHTCIHTGQITRLKLN